MKSTHEVCRPVEVRIVVSVSTSAICVIVPFFCILKFVDGKSAKNLRCSHTEIGNLSHTVHKVRWCDCLGRCRITLFCKCKSVVLDKEVFEEICTVLSSSNVSCLTDAYEHAGKRSILSLGIKDSSGNLCIGNLKCHIHGCNTVNKLSCRDRCARLKISGLCKLDGMPVDSDILHLECTVRCSCHCSFYI